MIITHQITTNFLPNMPCDCDFVERAGEGKLGKRPWTMSFCERQGAGHECVVHLSGVDCGAIRSFFNLQNKAVLRC
jgi:hypothetical protein